MVPNGVPRAAFWALGAGVVYAMGQVAVLVAGQPTFWLSSACLMVVFATIPWAVGKYRGEVDKTLRELGAIIELPEDEFDEFVDNLLKRIFLLGSPFAKLVIGAVGVAAVITLWTLDSPFDGTLLHVLAIIWFLPLILVGGHAVAVIILGVAALHDVASLDLDAPFFSNPPPSVAKLERVWLGGSSLIAFGYVLLLVAVWTGPHHFATSLLVWLGLLAVLPLLGFTGGAVEVHRILLKIKRGQVSIASERVNELAVAVEGDPQLARLDDLEAAMSIQSKLQSMREWPFSVSELLALIVALIPIAIQVAVVLSNVDRAT